MISHEDIKNLVSEWGLREDIIEKDYVIGWVLWGIGSDPTISHRWVFKGGTCLKKCYIETYRFSEDLDFTVLLEGPIKPEELLPIFDRILSRVNEESGIDFSVAAPKFKQRESSLSVEGRIYYRGPRNTPSPSSVKLDISAEERVVRPPVLREISHPYKDELPSPAQIRCYAFEEVFAEKIRAMGERSRPRDLYDIVNLFRRRDLQIAPKLIQSVLIKKCKVKEIPVPTFASIESSPYREELHGEWENMLGHQLQVLPPFQQFWEELPRLFNWLEGTYIPEKLASIPVQKDEDTTWSPPPTSWNWGLGIPLESVRFAAVNQLYIELEYRKQGHYVNHYLIEPYSLRRTKKNNLILHAIKADTQEHRAFRVDWIQSIKVSTKPFKPKYQIEFSPTDSIEALPTPRKSELSFSSKRFLSGWRSSRAHFGPTYIFKCSYCGRRFKKSKDDSTLRPHKDKNGYDCPGRTSYLVETRYD
ncbi:MAG: hypothetical protein COX49_04950 [bacterium (Candidatus Stahlbacteria) CG23_combo_of_CG06-09_8_20_14_all_40_9]|nr:MAG: hypothetical protein COX49_04950 [bacterium (Candidatus Stahlbacteria) CG23_combo_of_CG06-09_8_20_14_all_40_9]